MSFLKNMEFLAHMNFYNFLSILSISIRLLKMKFQGLFFLFALTSANLFDDAEEFNRVINEKLNITGGKKFTLYYVNTRTPITTTM